MAKTIAIINQKGGCAKTTTTIHLGIGLARAGKRVLLVDADPQASMTVALGWNRQDELKITLAHLLTKIDIGEELDPRAGVLQHAEGVDLVPANITMSSLEASMAHMDCREQLLKSYLALHKDSYDYILIDCLPSLGVLAVNCLTAADSVIVPVQPEFLSSVGMTLLFKAIAKVRRKLNPTLAIDGVLMTMADMRNNHAHEAVREITQALGGQVRLFDTQIPINVKVREASAKGRSVYVHSPKCRAALAYEKFTMEVLGE